MAIMTGLSGNEMYCLHLKGFAPGELVVGNSVYSMGFVGSFNAGIQTMAGGEVKPVTQVIHDGRLQALKRMSSVPKNSLRTCAAAPPSTLCAES